MVAPVGRLASPLGRVLLLAAAGACLLLALLAAAGRAQPAWLAALALALLVGMLAAGVCLQSSGVFARPLVSVDTSRPEVAITFDDGPGGHTAEILAALSARGHHATFFVVGERAARDPQALADIARGGHAIENHSWCHSYLTPFASPRRLAAELERTSTLIESVCGRRPRWFRPPVGLLSPRVSRAAVLAGLELIGWTVTARDGAAGTTPGQALARLERQIRPGAILVLHDASLHRAGTPIAVAVLPQLLELLEVRHLRSVTLSDLIAASPGAGAGSAGR
jgi:peptidoglycan/xylan/chitin deacetylase (PgdA/CDA1 family)